LKDWRKEALEELFAIQNKIDYVKNNTPEKKELLKRQKSLQSDLYDYDTSLKMLDEKRVIDHAILLMLVAPHRDLTQFLSNIEPIHSKTMLDDSQLILEAYSRKS